MGAPIAFAPASAPATVYSFTPLSLMLPTAPTTPILRSEAAIDPCAVCEGDGEPYAAGTEDAADADGDPSDGLGSPPQLAMRRDMAARRTTSGGKVDRGGPSPRWDARALRPRVLAAVWGRAIGKGDPASTARRIVSAREVHRKR